MVPLLRRLRAPGLIVSTMGFLRRMPRLFAVTVFIPTVLAVIYYGLIAADVFVSEAKFVVRSPQREPATGLGEFMERVGFATSQDDAYSVRDYMLSRDALRELDQALDLRAVYGHPRGDFLTRFPWIDFDDSFEALHEYYQGRVEVNIDPVSSISTILVRAFNADHALMINSQLLQMAENLVNQLNERGRQDLMKFAAEEVRLAEQKAQSAALAVREFRNLKGVFDPQQQSNFDLGQISRLQDELINTRTQLAEVLRLARYNPKVGALRDRIRALEAEIATASSKVAGEGGSLSDKYAEYARLALEQEFADKQLETALASLEQARNEAQRQQLYLERIVQPSEPDVAVLPERMQSVVVVFVVGVVLWGVLSMLTAGIREHQD
jgi:capsular polysaccharide transport system permease protein